ncbi:MAG: hypothetical protein IT355_11000 [Gemmatimonadaceae bacterium]|nr:hypothetical protein [Gemmatimonadaceae bacterium]
MQNVIRRAMAAIVAACAVVATAGAQGAAAPGAASAAFETFLRATAALGAPATAVHAAWPLPVGRAPLEHTMRFTPAHVVRLFLGPAASGRDSVTRLRAASYVESVADTVTLRARVQVLTRQLVQVRGGAADRCSTLQGEPAYLFVPQRGSRTWTKGAPGTAVQLTWEVAAGPTYAITVTSGMHLAADGEAAWVACP